MTKYLKRAIWFWLFINLMKSSPCSRRHTQKTKAVKQRAEWSCKESVLWTLRSGHRELFRMSLFSRDRAPCSGSCCQPTIETCTWRETWLRLRDDESEPANHRTHQPIWPHTGKLKPPAPPLQFPLPITPHMACCCGSPQGFPFRGLLLLLSFF